MSRVPSIPNPAVAAAQEPDPQEVLAIVEKHRNGRGELIAVLEAIQARYGYLPEAAMRTVSQQTGCPLVDVYGVATFYRLFSLKPRGKHLVCACLGTACHVRGAPTVVEELKDQLGIQPGETTPDGEFSFETVNCLGACALGPILVIDGRYFSKVRSRKVHELLERTRAGLQSDIREDDQRIFPVNVHCSHCNRSLMDPGFALDSHPSIRVSVLADGHQGRLRLSSLFGSSNVSSDQEIPPRSITRFFCPYCQEELCNGTPCPVCDAPLVPLIVEGGGTLQLCSRRGCGWHQLELL